MAAQMQTDMHKIGFFCLKPLAVLSKRYVETKVILLYEQVVTPLQIL